jgi:hypothetical protein
MEKHPCFAKIRLIQDKEKEHPPEPPRGRPVRGGGMLIIIIKN